MYGVCNHSMYKLDNKQEFVLSVLHIQLRRLSTGCVTKVTTGEGPDMPHNPLTATPINSKLPQGRAVQILTS